MSVSSGPQWHRSRDAVGAEASGQHRAAFSRSMFPRAAEILTSDQRGRSSRFAVVRLHVAVERRSRATSSSQNSPAPWEGHEGFGVFGRSSVVKCVLWPRACICCMERSSRSFSCNPEHGLRPLIHEIDVLHHASHVLAMRLDGQCAGSQARALLLDTGTGHWYWSHMRPPPAHCSHDSACVAPLLRSNKPWRLEGPAVFTGMLAVNRRAQAASA